MKNSKIFTISVWLDNHQLHSFTYFFHFLANDLKIQQWVIVIWAVPCRLLYLNTVLPAGDSALENHETF